MRKILVIERADLATLLKLPEGMRVVAVVNTVTDQLLHHDVRVLVEDIEPGGLVLPRGVMPHCEHYNGEEPAAGAGYMRVLPGG